MKELAKVALQERHETGKGACRKLRAEGQIPAVFYGPGYEGGLTVRADLLELAPVFKSGNWETSVLQLALPDGKEEMAIMKDVARDPLTGDLLHVDFYKLVKGHKVSVNVPVELVGRETCVGAKAGGVVELHLHEVVMDVLPSEIPDSVVVDISGLNLDESVLLSELSFPESAHVYAEDDAVVVAVSRPRSVEEEEEAEEEVTEVEVVAKGKQIEEE